MRHTPLWRRGTRIILLASISLLGFCEIARYFAETKETDRSEKNNSRSSSPEGGMTHNVAPCRDSHFSVYTSQRRE